MKGIPPQHAERFWLASVGARLGLKKGIKRLTPRASARPVIQRILDRQAPAVNGTSGAW